MWKMCGGKCGAYVEINVLMFKCGNCVKINVKMCKCGKCVETNVKMWKMCEDECVNV